MMKLAGAFLLAVCVAKVNAAPGPDDPMAGGRLAGSEAPVAVAALARASAGTGESPAQLREQAQALEHGEGVARNLPRALALYCEAARRGDAQAQFNLGWMYANGRGAARNEALAAFFFGLAARQSHPQAANMLRFVGEPAAAPQCMQDPEEERRKAALDAALSAAAPEQKKIVALMFQLAPDYGIDPALGLAVLNTESRFNTSAISPKNAQGLMQLIPETSARFNVTKPFDPEQNIRGGLSYLRWLMAYFKGQVPLVLAAYNAGEGAVDRYKGIPPFAETQDYVKRIMGTFRKSEHPYDASVTKASADLDAIQAKLRM
jgi:soluble lytic murein transglycosylase-like protein